MTTHPVPDAVLVGPLPVRWELAFGYRVDAPRRWLAAWWEPAGDEAMLADGSFSGTAHWPVFVDLVDRRLGQPVKEALATLGVRRWALGSSDNHATHSLLCDLHSREVWIAPLESVLRFLHEQAAPVIRELPQLDEAGVRALLDGINAAWQAEQAQRRTQALLICQRCHFGYIPTDEGYDPCIVCEGQGSRWVPRDEAEGVDRTAWSVILSA